MKLGLVGVDAPLWEKLEKGMLVPLTLGLAPSTPHFVLLSTATLIRSRCGVFLGHTCSLLLCVASLGPALRPPGPAHPASSALAFTAILLTPALPVNYILVKLIKKKKIFFLQGSNLMTSCKLTGFLTGYLAMTQAPNSITGQGVLWFGCHHTPRR